MAQIKTLVAESASMSARAQPTLDELYLRFQELVATQEREQQRKDELLATIDDLSERLSTARIDLIEANLVLRAIAHERELMATEMGNASMREHGTGGAAGGGGRQLPSLVFMR